MARPTRADRLLADLWLRTRSRPLMWLLRRRQRGAATARLTLWSLAALAGGLLAGALAGRLL